MKQSRINLVTHTDLDGVSCDIVTQKFANDNMKVKNITMFCEYDNVNDKIKYLIDEYFDGVFQKDKDILIISDISVNEEVAELLDKYYKDGFTITLLDHHKSAEWLNKYAWATVTELDTDDKPFCSTKLVYDYLYGDKGPDKLRHYVDIVRLYDTYTFKNAGKTGMTAEDLNLLYFNTLQVNGEHSYRDFKNHILETYIDDMSRKDLFLDGFTDEDNVIIDKVKTDQQRYINIAEKQLITDNMRGHDIGIIFIDKYVSKVCDVMLSLHPELDYIINFNLTYMKVDFRTQKDNIDVSDVAKLFGGGGHPKASGATLRKHHLKGFIDSYLCASKNDNK